MGLSKHKPLKILASNLASSPDRTIDEGVFAAILAILNPEQRRMTFGLIGLMGIAMILETLGITLVIPVIALIASPDFFQNQAFMEPVLDFFGNPTHQQLIAGAMAALVFAYLLKAGFLMFMAWYLNAFVFSVQATISQRLFAGYLAQPWPFHLDRNSAELIRNCTVSTTVLTHEALLPGMKLIAELMVVLGIATILFLVEPVGAAVVVGVLAGIAWVYQLVTHRMIIRWGKEREFHEGKRIQHLQEGLGGAKEVKLLGRESEFWARYGAHNVAFAKAGQRHNTLLQLPPLWLEVLAVCGLAGLVVIMVLQGRSPGELLPTLGLFAAAAFRLMPSANRMIDALHKLRYGLPIVKTVHKELASLEQATPPSDVDTIAFEHAIKLSNVDYRYPGAESYSLEGVSLTIERGSSVGIIGGSGAGKSTLVDIVLGLLDPIGGAVTVDDVDIRQSLRAWQSSIGYVPQSIFLLDDTLRRNIAFALPDERIDEDALQNAVRMAQLEQFVSDLPDGLETRVGERGVKLSGGQRQRIGIARALYSNPDVLVLDEATSALDTQTEAEVMAAVNRLHGSKTLLIIAHRLSTIEGCDVTVRLERGRVIDIAKKGVA